MAFEMYHSSETRVIEIYNIMVTAKSLGVVKLGLVVRLGLS